MGLKVYTFTTCGAAGKNGCTQQQVDDSYENTNLSGKVTSLNGIQQCKFPPGVYTIEALGAKGGNQGEPLYGGKGARMKGTFTFKKMTTLRILVGQKGQDVSTEWDAGGGGGTFVVKIDESSQFTMVDGKKVIPLIIAGGGSGAGSDCNGQDGVISENALNNSNIGHGATNLGQGAGGGGFLDNGGDRNRAGGGKGFLQGGQGGHAGSNGGEGGFGGGAGGQDECGAGAGGYTGSAGYDSSSTKGAGSYNSGEEQENEAGVNNDDGKVIITLIKSFGKYLLKDNDDNNYKFYNISSENWETIGTKLTEELFQIKGTDDPYLNKLHLLDLKNNPNILSYDKDITISSRKYKTNLIPYYQIVKQTDDIDFNVTRLVFAKPTQTVDNIRYVVSSDSGETWKTYKNKQWSDINLTQKELLSNGMTNDEIRNIKLNEWRKLNLSKIRFAFYLETTLIESVSINNMRLFTINKYV